MLQDIMAYKTSFFKGFWTHNRFMDVCIYVEKVSFYNEEKTKLKVTWFLKRDKTQPLIHKKDNIVITKDQYKNWSPL